MTGFGEARFQSDELTLGVEVRSVNNRHLKVTVRGSEPYPMLESEVEKVVRRHLKRGTLLVQIRVDRTAAAANSKLNTALVKAYLEQLHRELKDVRPEDRTALM